MLLTGTMSTDYPAEKSTFHHILYRQALGFLYRQVLGKVKEKKQSLFFFCERPELDAEKRACPDLHSLSKRPQALNLALHSEPSGDHKILDGPDREFYCVGSFTAQHNYLYRTNESSIRQWLSQCSYVQLQCS